MNSHFLIVLSKKQSLLDCIVKKNVEGRGAIIGPITRPRFGDERQSVFDQEEFVNRDPDSD